MQEEKQASNPRCRVRELQKIAELDPRHEEDRKLTISNRSKKNLDLQKDVADTSNHKILQLDLTRARNLNATSAPNSAQSSRKQVKSKNFNLDMKMRSSSNQSSARGFKNQLDSRPGSDSSRRKQKTDSPYFELIRMSDEYHVGGPFDPSNKFRSSTGSSLKLVDSLLKNIASDKISSLSRSNVATPKKKAPFVLKAEHIAKSDMSKNKRSIQRSKDSRINSGSKIPLFQKMDKKEPQKVFDFSKNRPSPLLARPRQGQNSQTASPDLRIPSNISSIKPSTRAINKRLANRLSGQDIAAIRASLTKTTNFEMSEEVKHLDKEISNIKKKLDGLIDSATVEQKTPAPSSKRKESQSIKPLNLESDSDVLNNLEEMSSHFIEDDKFVLVREKSSNIFGDNKQLQNKVLKKKNVWQEEVSNRMLNFKGKKLVSQSENRMASFNRMRTDDQGIFKESSLARMRDHHRLSSHTGQLKKVRPIKTRVLTSLATSKERTPAISKDRKEQSQVQKEYGTVPYFYKQL